MSMRYTSSHEWLRYYGVEVTIGITDHAQQSLGEIAFVELPAVGATISRGETLCVLESVKAASEILSPVSGVVQRVNESLEGAPQLLNRSPEQDGWLCVLGVSSAAETMGKEEREEFLSSDQYAALIGK